MAMRNYFHRSVILIIQWVIVIIPVYVLWINYNNKSIVESKPDPYAKIPVTTFEMYMKYRDMFVNLGEEDYPRYRNGTPFCQLNFDTLGPIKANKADVPLHWLGGQLPDVKPGGYYAPQNCRPRHKVAILVTYRDRKKHLPVFLRHMHPFLMKQMIEYRIFLIEQYGTGKFNKGALYNIGFLESQRFGEWHCYIFHDLDLLPLDERILYTCPRRPTHMSTAVESLGYELPYPEMFGGVTALTPTHFYAVNGYSNMYWDWGAEDDDMFIRLQSRRFSVVRYHKSIARYATLPHKRNHINSLRHFYLSLAKHRFRNEGLRTIKYKLLNGQKRRLYTYILVDLSPLEKSKVN